MFRKTLGFYILFLITGIILAVYPAIDIWFSNLFYQGEKQFFVKHYLVGENYYYEFIIRRFALPLIVIFLLFSPVVAKLFLSLKFKIRLFNIKTQDIFYIWLSAFFISLFINSVLKEGWGRSRPNDIINFGGSNYFTSWIQYSLECTSNCSFVSGDAAVGFFIVVYYYLTKNIFFFYLSIIVGLLLGVVRIGAGAHFLSDIVMSFVFVNLGLIIINYVYYGFLTWIKK